MNNILSEGNRVGFVWRVRHNGIGYRCGYVKIPEGHPWYKKDCDEVNANVHGGLTYGADEGDGWWIGFDCAHLGDAQDPELPSSCRMNTPGIVRTQQYVEEECHALCEQALNAKS
jgi:hypothetical protein